MKQICVISFVMMVGLVVPTAEAARFLIGPVPGLTTAWHTAPHSVAIPIGTTLTLKSRVPPGTTIAWSGATEMAIEEGWSVAECHLSQIGNHPITVTQRLPNGAHVTESMVLDVVAITLDQIELSPVRATVDPVVLDEENLNTSTFRYFSGLSIADLRQVSESWYRTSVLRPVAFSLEVDPPGFAPLMEWRSSGKVPRLGSSRRFTHQNPHLQHIEVGPIDNPQRMILETYRVEITSHISDHDVIHPREPVTFKAITFPRGHEDEITWLASTKYGVSDRVLGRGPQFTVTFEDTWGPQYRSPDPFQWLGVKADNAAFNQDQKCNPFLLPYDGARHFLAAGLEAPILVKLYTESLAAVSVVAQDLFGTDIDNGNSTIQPGFAGILAAPGASQYFIDLPALTGEFARGCYLSGTSTLDDSNFATMSKMEPDPENDGERVRFTDIFKGKPTAARSYTLSVDEGSECPVGFFLGIANSFDYKVLTVTKGSQAEIEADPAETVEIYARCLGSTGESCTFKVTSGKVDFEEPITIPKIESGEPAFRDVYLGNRQKVEIQLEVPEESNCPVWLVADDIEVPGVCMGDPRCLRVVPGGPPGQLRAQELEGEKFIEVFAFCEPSNEQQDCQFKVSR